MNIINKIITYTYDLRNIFATFLRLLNELTIKNRLNLVFKRFFCGGDGGN